MSKYIQRSLEMHLVGYYLARCGMREPQKPSRPPAALATSSWQTAFDRFYPALGNGRTETAFRGSMRAVLSSFDTLFPQNGRKGWEDAQGHANPLDGMYREILDEWADRSDHELEHEALRYAVAERDAPTSTRQSDRPTQAAPSLRERPQRDPAILDSQMRMAAFGHVRQLAQIHGQLSQEELAHGFRFEGRRIPLFNPRRGIFKPQQMPYLLSIKTVFPKPGNRVWYDDQRDVHRQIFEGEELIDYAFMGDDPEAADNRWLREACERQIPIIYFLGISPGRYEAILPVFIADWDARALKARVSFGLPNQAGVFTPPNDPLERRYALRSVKQRLHQASFREAVITAYRGRCAISGLPEQRLLDAAHIIADSEPELGQPIVPNGIPLSKIHHAAFDAHLIGIDPDYRLHVSDKLLGQNDGPILEALKGLVGSQLHRPLREKDCPDRDRLEKRFERFKEVA
jgi:putative restriction endonuclease